MQPFVSVCICTFNRAPMLGTLLGCLSAQSGARRSDYEVLIVDNNSADDTQAVVREYAASFPVSLVREPAQGLSHARNRAISEVKGEWVLFTDDDVVLDDQWLHAFVAALREFPQAFFAGGRIVPDWGGAAPRWFKGEKLDLFDGVLVWYDLGAETRLLTSSDPLPFGASFAVRLDMFERFGGFRTDLGVVGRRQGRGEETEFLGRLRAAGLPGVYVGAAVCHHPVDRQRLTLSSLFNYGRASASAHSAITDVRVRGSLLAVISFAVRGLYQLARGRGDRFRQCVINVGIQAELLLSRGR